MNFDDIFESGILSKSCHASCNCRKQFETSDSEGQKDKNGGNSKK